METSYITKRLECIQRELEELKRLLEASPQKPLRSLEGIWAGMDVSDEDIEEAKRAVFRDAYREWPKTSS